MTNAPERINLDGDSEAGQGMFPRCFENPKYCSEPAIEYVRADLVEAMEAKNQRLREALVPFGDAADLAIEAVSKTVTLGVLGALAPYFVTWQDFRRARAALRDTREGG